MERLTDTEELKEWIDDHLHYMSTTLNHLNEIKFDDTETKYKLLQNIKNSINVMEIRFRELSLHQAPDWVNEGSVEMDQSSR